MTSPVAILGIGFLPARPRSPESSYKEMTYQAAVRAYADAGISPRDVGTFVTCAEDLLEGTSIFDEYTPDQLGAVQRPMHTVTADGLFGVAAAAMQIATGRFEIAVVEAHSKASNLLTLPRVLHYASDPTLNRPLELHPYALAGLEMRRFLRDFGATHSQCARVVVKNRANALRNPSGCYGGAVTVDQVRESAPVAEPLTEAESAPHADGAAVVVLGSERAARVRKRRGRKRRGRERVVWITGMGWCSDSPSWETRAWGDAAYLSIAGKMAARQAGLKTFAKRIDFAEIDDTFAYKELQHIEALGLCGAKQAGRLVERGYFDLGGDLPVNPSGGCLGQGNLLEASGLYRVCEIVAQLRGEAGARQVDGAKTALAASWRGVPTTTGAVAMFSRAKP